MIGAYNLRRSPSHYPTNGAGRSCGEWPGLVAIWAFRFIGSARIYVILIVIGRVSPAVGVSVRIARYARVARWASRGGRWLVPSLSLYVSKAVRGPLAWGTSSRVVDREVHPMPSLPRRGGVESDAKATSQ